MLIYTKILIINLYEYLGVIGDTSDDYRLAHLLNFFAS